ncbi:MAG: hypothetical protein A2X82_01940 [Geobacteraceae bacterium GWC2_55_20]|nr:MAG: hypothetical protein A2X82_01940 [Geobacteraceae bacterium GWC2_55_20]
MIGCNRKKRNVSCAFDRLGNFSLVSCAVAGNTSRNDLSALGNKKTKCARLFVIDGQVFLGAETAYFTTLERASFARAAGAASRALARAASRALI